MNIFELTAPLQEYLEKTGKSKKHIGLVPTMGNLHEGHLALVKKARQECDCLLATIFVNPAQFGPGEDLEQYPRTPEQDIELLKQHACDALFIPEVREMYPEGSEQHAVVSMPHLSTLHCGASRPGHFDGVCTVVSKLFNLCRPGRAYFGQKDYQQLIIIKKLVQDLCMPVEIIGVPTVRDTDGLALSSRNAYLDSAEKKQASILYRVLNDTAEMILNDPQADFTILETAAAERISDAGLRSDYFSICNAATLLPATRNDNELVILAAAYLGETRLIDNILIKRGQ